MHATSDQPPISAIARRSLLGAAPGFLLYALLAEARAATPSRRDPVLGWIDGQQQIATDLAAGRIAGRRWSAEVERLASGIDVDQLLAHVRRSDVRPAGDPSGNDPQKRFVRFKDETGATRKLAYGVALFDFSPTNVITPHAHRHMVSAHMIVSGAMRVRNFNRVADRDGAIVIWPTRDYRARVGDVSTMCSERNNIHWFVPVGGPASTFDVIISGLDEGQPDYKIEPVDPVRGRRLADGSIVAPVLGFEESSRLYTAKV